MIGSIPASREASIPGCDAVGVAADRLAPGTETVIGYPFVRDTFTKYDEEGGFDVATWRPGVRYEDAGQYGENVEAVADGEGQAIFTTVAVFKPGKYPTRVFYTRRYVRPDGQGFGKGKLHIATVEKFRRLTNGYRDPYRLDEADDAQPASPTPRYGEAVNQEPSK